MPTKKRASIGDEATKKRTGKTVAQWFSVLMKSGAKKLEHKDIAKMLQSKHDVSAWWAQTITVEFEYAKKGRKVGQTADAGYQIGVTKTIDVPHKKAWSYMTSSKGRAVWLGASSTFRPKERQHYRTKNGTKGEVRTVRTGDRLRMTWQPRAWKKPTTLQVSVIPRKQTKGTCIAFHQEKLPNQSARAKMRTHWQQVLRRIERDLT